MIYATINENIKANKFLSIVNFLPKYLISTGIVTIPTIMSVDRKAPICMYPAPFLSSMAAVGKATNPGIKVIDPTVAAITTPTPPRITSNHI